MTASGTAKVGARSSRSRSFNEADKCIGQVLDALEEQKLTDSTVVILTADHGGRQKWHGPNDPRARHIPWIVVGPGVKAGLDLDSIMEQQVNIEDTFATACTMLGIETVARWPARWSGRFSNRRPLQRRLRPRLSR